MKKIIEQVLSVMLQRDVQLTCNNKNVKQGKLINYAVNDYVITLTIRNNKDQLKSYDVYYPYHVTQQENTVVFDYTVDTLTAGQQDLIDTVAAHSKEIKNHKLFDSRLVFKY